MRFLLILALLCGVIFMFRILYSRYLRSSQEDWSRQNAKSESAEAETMVHCRQCGTYFPISEAISGPSDLVFCCEDHLRRYLSAH